MLERLCFRFGHKETHTQSVLAFFWVDIIFPVLEKGPRSQTKTRLINRTFIWSRQQSVGFHFRASCVVGSAVSLNYNTAL